MNELSHPRLETHMRAGVGKSVAASWYLQGLRTLDDVRELKGGIKLTASQEVCEHAQERQGS